MLCSGRVYYDLQRHAERASADEVAIARIEQLYPFPTAELTELLDGYPGLERSSGPRRSRANMGAWRSLRHRLEEADARRACASATSGRPWRGSPSEGYRRDHARAGPHRAGRARPPARRLNAR